MDFQSEKSFGKLRLRAFQPYHQILCILKHVEDVKDYTQLIDKLESVKGEYNTKVGPNMLPVQHARRDIPIQSKEAIEK